MSLINQMLRDLEQRRTDDNDPRRVRAVADSGRSNTTFIWLGLATFLLPVIGGLGWLFLPFPGFATNGSESYEAVLDTRIGLIDANESEEEQAITPFVDPTVDLPTDGPVDTAVTLLAVERVETRDGHRLRLDFDGDSAYRRRASSEDRLVLEVQAIPGPELADSLPPGVSQLQHSELNDSGHRLELMLEDGWEAGPLYLETAPGGGDRLSLSLRRPEPPARQSGDAESTPADRAERADSSEATVTASASDESASHAVDEVVATADDALEGEEGMRRERRTRSDEDRAAEAWTEAREALQRGRMGTAESALERVLALHPPHVPAREALADLLADTGRLEEADQVLAESLDIERLPASELGYFARQRARLWLGQDDTPRGIEALETVYPERDAAPESGALLAGLYYRQGDYPRAVDHYRQLTEQRPEQGAWWMGLGLALEGMADYDAAADAYRRALAGDGLGPSVRDYLQARVRELTD